MSLETDTAEGLLRYATNEERNDSRVDDPSAYRGGQPFPNTLVKISGDVVTFAGGLDANGRGVGEVTHRDERAFIAIKGHDPASQNDSLKCGSIEFFCTIEGRSDDAAQRRVMTLTPYELRVYVPIRQMAGPPSDPPPTLWPATAPVTRGGAGGTGPEWLNIYRGYMANDVSRIRNAPASEAQLGLVNEYRTRYGYLDDRGYNWLIATFIIPGVV